MYTKREYFKNYNLDFFFIFKILEVFKVIKVK